MKTTHRRIAAGALLASTAAVVGFGLSSVAAQADTGVPHQWCPGDSDPTAPHPGGFDWDWNVCHTYYWVKSGQGNVPYRGSLRVSNLWDGDNPPADSYSGCGTDLFTGRPGSC